MNLKHLLAGLLVCAAAFAQGTVSVDLLDPSETSGTIPANLRIVDVHVQLAPTEVIWTAGGIRAVTSNGAVFAYHDGDANTPELEPGLINPGLADRFLTSLSKPRPRNANSRFTAAVVAAAGGYNPASPFVTTQPDQLNVAYFFAIPEWEPPQPREGYVARIAVDVSGVPGAPAGNDHWGLGEIAPPDATVVLSSIPPPQGTQSPGTVIATFNVPAIHGINWRLWFVPEPESGALLFVFGTALASRMVRRCVP